MFKGRVVVKKRIWVTLQNKRLDLCMPKQKGTPEKMTELSCFKIFCNFAIIKNQQKWDYLKAKQTI